MSVEATAEARLSPLRSPWLPRIVQTGLWLLAIAWWAGFALVGRSTWSESAYLTVRLAREIQAGNGPRLPVPEPAPLTYPVAPFVAAAVIREPMLGLSDQNVIALNVVGFAAAVIGGIALSGLFRKGWLAPIYVVFMGLSLSPALILMQMLVLLALLIIRRRDSARWSVISGVLLGLACCTDPSAVLVTGLLLVRSRPVHRWYLMIAWLLTVGGILGSCMWIYRAPFQWLPPTIATIPFMPIMILVAAWEVVQVRRWAEHDPDSRLLLRWGIFLAAIAVIDRKIGMIFCALIPVGLIALSGWEKRWSRRWLYRWVVALLIIAEVAMATVTALLLVTDLRPKNYAAMVQIGDRLSASDVIAIDARTAPPDDSCSIVSVGSWSTALRGRILDLSGNLQTAGQTVATEPFQLEDPDFFLRAAPDALLLSAGRAKRITWPNFATTYAKTVNRRDIGILSADLCPELYQRVVTFTPLTERPVTDWQIVCDTACEAAPAALRAYPQLSGIAVATAVKRGDLVRIRLDWQVQYVPTIPLVVRLTLATDQSTAQPTAQSNAPPVTTVDQFAPERWRTGRVSTYHVIVIPNESPLGMTQLAINLATPTSDGSGSTVVELRIVNWQDS